METLLVTLLNFLALQGARERTNLHYNDITLNLYQPGGNSTQLADFNLPQPQKIPIKVIIHDWTDSPQSPWIAQMLETMGSRNRWHVIALDWSKVVAAAGGGYRGAYTHSGLVADRLAEAGVELLRANAIPLRWLHFVGHGLGALIALQSAHKITAQTGKRIARVTALDPTLGAFGTRKLSEELKDVAKFVDVIHTNGGVRGTFDPFGHVDFYPNGGRQQPGCNNTTEPRCNHNRACEYWSASCKDALVFRAYNYKQWMDYVNGEHDKLIAQPMGIGAHVTMPWGPYFLETKNSTPYVLPYL